MERIPLFLKNNDSEKFRNFFFNFTFEILNKDISDKYNDTLVRKFIIMTENILKDKEFEKLVSQEILEEFLEKIKNIILLKYDNDYQNFCFNISKNNNPIWLFAANQLLKLTSILIENFQMNKLLADIFRTILSKKDKKSIL